MRGTPTASWWRPPRQRAQHPAPFAPHTHTRRLTPSTRAHRRPSPSEISALQTLGPRIKWAAVNTTEQLLDLTLFTEVADPKHYGDYLVHRALPNDHWPHKIAAQLLTRKACRDAVVTHEQARGRPYEVYVRVRLDTQLFAPVPASFFTDIGRADAVIPAGENYRGPNGRSVNDRFLWGGADAFRADAEVWQTIIHPAARGSAPWVLESLSAEHLEKRGSSVRIEPLAYCILSISGTCRYPGELAGSLKLLPRLLLDKPASAAAALCGDLGSGGACDSTRKVLQTNDWAREDPGWCRLAVACASAIRTRTRALPPAACCLADGTVTEAGVPVQGTRRCSRAELPSPAEEGAACDASCPEAVRLAAIRGGRVSKRELELVVSRTAGEPMGWSDAYVAVRTVYCQGPCGAMGKFVRTAIELRNVGLEAHAYLQHIVSRYDSLAERTAFMHGKAPSCGFWQPSGGVGGHLLLNVSMADYLEPTTPGASDVFMPVTMLVGSALDRFTLRSTFAASAQAAHAKVPRPVSPLPTDANGDAWQPWEANQFGQFVREQAQKARREGGGGNTTIMEFDGFFKALFGRAPPPVLQVAQGAQFAASRAALRRVPLATYRWLLELIEQGHAEVPYYLELLWLYLLQPSTFDTPLPRMTGEEALLPFLHHLGAPTARRRASAYQPYEPTSPSPPPMSPGKAMVAKQGALLTSPTLVLPFESPDAFETSDEFALLCPALLLLAGCAVEGPCTCTLSVTPGSVNVVAELFIPEDSGVDASQAESQFVALEDDTPAELSDTLGTTVESISGSVSLQTGVTRLVQVNAPPPPSAPPSATSGTAAVAGGVAGGVVFAMLVAGVLYWRWRSGQRRRIQPEIKP